MLRPIIEVIANGDCARCTLSFANGPVLREGARSRDGRLISPCVGADSVSTAI
jgi:hypothetical protein